MPEMMHGKVVGTVTAYNDDRRYALATDSDGNTYFLYERYFDTVARWGFDDIQFGSVVKFIPTEGPKGLRAVDIEVVKQ